MEESLRVVTDDDETPEKTKRREPAFVEIKLDVDPFCRYYPPSDRDAWKDLRGRPKCNKLYLRRDVDTVETLKIFISACFIVDVAVSNIKLRIVEETFAGSKAYRPWELNDDNTILGLHQAVKDNKLWIWVSKKVDMRMWHVLEYKVDNSITIEKLEHERILSEAIAEVEDKWLMFVSQNLEKIKSVLEFTLWVWWTEGEREAMFKRGKLSRDDKKIIEQLEERSVRFDRLRNYVLQRRVLDETESMRLSRKECLHELYYNGNDPRSV
jgi:hypothetical protein